MAFEDEKGDFGLSNKFEGLKKGIWLVILKVNEGMKKLFYIMKGL